MRAAFARSARLVRGHFWLVFWVLVPIELVGDALTNLITDLADHLLGGSLLAEWLADTASNIVLTPFYAVAAVLLTLDLIAARGRRGPRLHSAPAAPMTTASIFIDFWDDQIVADGQAGPLPRLRRLHPLLRLHPDEHAADAQPQGPLVAGEHRQRERRPRPPPRLRDRRR